MRRRTLVPPLVVLILLGLYGCSETFGPTESIDLPPVRPTTQWEGDPCGEQTSVQFLAGQFIETGTVTVGNDEGSLCVQIVTSDGWVLEQTHVAVALSLEEIPQTGSGNPKIGQFALSAEHDPPLVSFDHCIDMAVYGYEEGDTLYIAVHGEVALLDAGGAPIQRETAWAEGTPFPGQSWAMYFTYVVQSCAPPPPPEGVTVVYPNGGEEFCVGEDIVIFWETVGEGCADFVSVELLHHGEVCAVLADNLVNFSFLDWMVESCDGDSTGYAIRVTDLTCGYADESDSTFVIREECGGGGPE